MEQISFAGNRKVYKDVWTYVSGDTEVSFVSERRHQVGSTVLETGMYRCSSNMVIFWVWIFMPPHLVAFLYCLLHDMYQLPVLLL